MPPFEKASRPTRWAGRRLLPWWTFRNTVMNWRARTLRINNDQVLLARERLVIRGPRGLLGGSIKLEPVLQPESYLKRFRGVENVRECRRGGWGYSGDIVIGNVVIATIRQIQKISRNAPMLIQLISEPHIE